MILSAMQSAATRLIGQRPGTFFGAAGKFEAEITDLINEAAEDIAQYQDWQALTRVANLVGGENVTLPADYGRMMINSSVMDPTNWVWGYFAFTDINAYLYEKARGFTPWPGGWIIYDGQMHFSPATSGEAQFPYITKNWARAAGGAVKSQFSNDTDTFLLPERLLTLWLVWRWRENKKLDAAGDQEAFVKALDEYAAKDRGSVIQRSGRSRLRGLNVGIAYPGGWA